MDEIAEDHIADTRENVFKVSAQNFRYHLRDIIGLKFPIVFQPIIIQNFDVWFALVLHLNCTALSQSIETIP